MIESKRFVLSVLAAGALLVSVPVVAHEAESGDGDGKKFHIHGEVRVRGEYTENYFDLTDSTASGGVNDDEYGYGPYRVRISADGKIADNVRAFVELQGHGHLGNDGPFWNDTFPPDQSFEPFSDQDDVNLYQAFIELQEIGGSSLDVRIGRQEHTYNTELLLGDSDFYAGTSFDGIRGWFGGDAYEVNLFYYKIFENNVFQGIGFVGNGGSVDQNYFGGTADWNLGDGGGKVGAYVTKFQGHNFDASWWTLGGHYTRMPSKENAFDWNAELAIQSGEFSGGPDIKGHIFEGWVGYGFGEGGRHRIHVGTLIASGDDNPSDGDIEDFFSLFGDIHAWNRLGDADFFTITNITDWNAGWKYVTESEKHWFGVAVHKFALTEELGADPVNSFFGPSPVTLDDDLGTEIDLKYGHKFAENTKISVGLARFDPGDAYGPSTDDVLRLYGQVKVRW